MPLQPSDKGQFVAMLAAVAAVYGKEVSPGVIDVYWAALSAYDIDAVRQAFDRHVKNPDSGQFMPKPADLIRMLGGTTTDASAIAWAKVERAIRLVGGYESVVFDDPVIHRCIDDMGGWPKLCDGKEDEMPFKAKHFTTLYRGIATTRDIPSYPGHLVGRYEAENVRKGFKASQPVLVGNRSACDVVRIGGAAERTLMITRDQLVNA